MYRYKLNNSYTVYVNHIYLNDCIKAGKEWLKYYDTSSKATKKVSSSFFALPTGTSLRHKTYGIGKVISTDKNGIMTIEFARKVARFVYPDSVKQGFLSLVH